MNTVAAAPAPTKPDAAPGPVTNGDTFETGAAPVLLGAVGTAGIMSAADGPLPFGEIAGLALIGTVAVSQIPTGGGKNVGDRVGDLVQDVFFAKGKNKGKDDWKPRKPPRKKADQHKPDAGTERNVGGHHGAGKDNTEHSRVNKGPKGPRR